MEQNKLVQLLAARGAIVRREEITGELAEIEKFLRSFRPKPTRVRRPAGQQQGKKDKVLTLKRRHGMSIAARKAVSRRMKRYWAERRAAKR